MLRSFFLVLLPIYNLVFAAPATHSLEKRRPPSQVQIDGANGMFPGIDWTFTATTGCDSSQFAILQEATRMALEMMKHTGEDLNAAFDTVGFNRYFMKTDTWKKIGIWGFGNRKSGDSCVRSGRC